ncbi:type VI secretion system baseplate subunit TssE [Moritella sp.]|uniref:type VI secretion system baseplate subunit TssE n=1 Tax=Moritella sp. TaxID=78556 RepID=UPI001D2DD360|nr:type VI secretion system baseplate subunit TssE [Moritella sp.]MCJ8349258.1 type VI secretion system baseplate subunit TssE [Moritella sp.]NQZ39546.1 type VI secretion system baseplate subunit TssE [Moritella sp.]
MSLFAKMKGDWTANIDDLRDAIIENIASLLSAKSPIWGDDDVAKYTDESIALLGMSHAVRGQNRANSEHILQSIKQLITKFEPRIKDLNIELEEESVVTNKLKFRIEGVIVSEFGEELVVFDSSLDFTTSSVDVRKTNFV